VVEQKNLGEHLFFLYGGDGDANASLKQVLVLLRTTNYIELNEFETKYGGPT